MDRHIYLSQYPDATDIFKDLSELSMSNEPHAEGQHPIYKDSGDLTLHLPGFSKALSPSKWHKFDIGEILKKTIALKEPPKTAVDLQDITSGTYFQEELNKINLMADFVNSLCASHETHLSAMKENNLIAPVHALEQYADIVKNAKEALTQAIYETLPTSEASKVGDPHKLTSQSSPTKYLSAAKKQNESLILEYLNSRTTAEAAALLAGMSALELSKHPNVLGNVFGSKAALTTQSIKQNAENAIHIHLATTIQAAKLPPEIASTMLDSSTKISKALSLSSLTHLYDSSSSDHQKAIISELESITPQSVKVISKEFSQSLMAASKHTDKNSLSALTSEIASTFSGKSPKENGVKADLLKQLLESTIFTLKNPEIDKNPIINNSAVRTQTQGRH